MPSALRKFCSWKRAFLVLAVSMAESTAKLSSEVEDLSSSSEDEHIGRGVFNTVASRRTINRTCSAVARVWLHKTTVVLSSYFYLQIVPSPPSPLSERYVSCQ